MASNTERTARANWTGTLIEGSGTVDFASGAFPTTTVTWAARTEESNGKTSPEELIAAAHASCYAMAFTNTMVQAGHEPESVSVSATVGLGPKEGGGIEVKTSQLSVSGRVPGIDQAQFEELAKQGEQGCPVSNALRGNVEISVNATLEP